MVLIKAVGCKPTESAENAGFKKVLEMMRLARNFMINISEPGYMENAQICAGGIDFNEISTEMESNIVKGLYFAGELVDIDGMCGGYNLQWAWSSGYVAGLHAAGHSKDGSQ